MDDLEENLKRCQTAGHVTPFLLQGLLGKWRFQRTLTQLANGSAQSVSGTIHFALQNDHETGADYILYREDGVMQMPNGRAVEVFREYHYIVNPSDGALEIFIVEFGKRAHLFLSLLFEHFEDPRTNEQSWIAGADHLCIKDLYDAKFQVELDGLAARRVLMKYAVGGPAKDYEALTILTPDS
jgi:hypothetical protein